ncbi:MAG TPA: L-fuconate dehydratase [Vicinamibacterales bacterium]|nr:L-fuconate dehydratase [Vicinamibacterales bacterium]
MKITGLSVSDLRFPTSTDHVGSDAVHTDPDYSAAYVILTSDGGLEGHGLTFTIGRGNEVCAAAIDAFRHLVVGRDLRDITSDFGNFWHSLAGESQLRWLGPEKGVIHLALAAVVNAVWDLYAKSERKPVWKLLADMTPAELVSCVDFHHMTDALTPDDARAILERHAATKGEREAALLKSGYPAYTTSVGWLGYSDEKIHRLCQEALADGWTHFKVKVGGMPQDDLRRLTAVRAAIGPDHKLMIDSNQRWDVDEAIARIKELSHLDLWWAEEPTHPDDVLGHARIAKAIAPIGVATGEHAANRVIFKQLLQASAITFCQIDSCRLGGVNENLAVMLMAAKFGVRVCPHAGGVGLCEYVQHLSMFDYIGITGTMEGRVIEFVDHLHEHFEEPVTIRRGRYMPPTKPGYSITIKPESRARYRFPDGDVWRGRR